MTTVQNPHDAYMHAAQLLDEGQIKDAYLSFLSVVELSTKQLYGVKFVHHTVVSTPNLYEVAISMIRSSLSHLDEIVVKRSLPFQKSAPHTPETKRDDAFARTKPAVPPKPKTLPALPPTTTTTATSASPSSSSSPPNSCIAPLQASRSRGNSVSFAPQVSSPVQVNVDEVHMVGEVDDDDDDDDVDVVSHPNIFRPHTIGDSHVPPVVKEAPPRKSLDAYQYHRQQASVHHGQLHAHAPHPHHPYANSPHHHHPHHHPAPLNAYPWPPHGNHHHLHHHLRPDAHPMDILADSLVDPSILVPAQTNPGDNLALPLSTTSLPTSDYVPLIPMPPLLSTHRLLQTQLTDLETSLGDYKAKKRAIQLGEAPGDASEKELDDRILQRNASVAETRETLNKVRTLYMSAATVPSVMQFPPYLVAYQLTLMDAALFRNIPCNALLTHSARSPHPKIVASTDFFNYMTRAIEHSILLPLEAARRAEIINRWIKIATKCLLLNNYQTLKAIVAALGTPPVQRLRRTWDCIPKKRMARLELLNTLTSELDNYGRYREHLGLLEKQASGGSDAAVISSIAPAAAPAGSLLGDDALHSSDQPVLPTASMRQQHDKPIIPFLGVFIHDITYLLAAIKRGTRPQDDSRIQDVLTTVQTFQMAPPYPSVPPASYIKACQPKKHSFRPSASLITQALQRSSAKQRNNSMSSTASLNSSTAAGLYALGDDPQRELELEQQLITQYLLMRPWVNERIVDELSMLREPPKPRSGSSPGPRYNSSNSSNSTTQPSTSAHSYASSIFSGSTRMQSTTSSITSIDDDDYFPNTCDDDDDDDEFQGNDTISLHAALAGHLNKQDRVDRLEIAATTSPSSSSSLTLHHSTSTSTISAEPTPRSSSTFHPLRTVQSFTRSSTSSAQAPPPPPPPPPHPKESSLPFSIVGHLRSLSLPTSENPVTFRKKS
ncbi:hypothetical protein BC940DRAFT_363952 [Gongronella butleri]|nr:hypothetical protein BC940DRAFT_363952 [Gongronella butleri]